jgi:hypothetical protein
MKIKLKIFWIIDALLGLFRFRPGDAENFQEILKELDEESLLMQIYDRLWKK